jgi:hypothetical protein
MRQDEPQYGRTPLATKIDIIRKDEGIEFVPSPLEVLPRTEVFFRNLDPHQRHHISLFEHPLERRMNSIDRSVRVRVTERIDYFCKLHPDERGTVVVSEAVV